MWSATSLVSSRVCGCNCLPYKIQLTLLLLVIDMNTRSQPIKSTRDFWSIHRSYHKFVCSPLAIIRFMILAAKSLCLKIDFIVPEKLLLMCIIQKFDLDKCFVVIHRDHKQLEANNFHKSLIVAMELRSVNFRRPIPPSSLGLHRVS